ncbi:hypothetical protein ACH475_14030 [Streptomyces globisporus]|uniref:hypothetical protein n=1 Tax=Streptomyces TaxID=1883 RepID=UPI000BF1F471|nr:hypothetical protein [Streptomyces sp. st170]WSV94044.1 hypothetical protein OG449_34395 [Streptomyces globisporus]
MFAVIDSLLVPFLLAALAVVCTAFVCIVAIARADRRDVVAVVRALPELAAVLVRFRRQRQ